ncbi:DNA polymerase III subunit chi [Novosphingobium sp.]|uniref:DNA polymerase III subunit chi n=1 Tax=Novosphingobium sp. TaxID=1874826 RepID=UPI002733A509|nr:DNA polymerase III subunit chi [Novosphingobium sp.]MDP3907243.1 DNA polymerase III subunit chi [Novosphingobium sp.]
MRVDFYQLGQGGAESALPLIARNTLKLGERLLVVSADDDLTARLSQALWALKDSFLAHGLAGGPHDASQPVLLADLPDAANGARYIAMADGRWLDQALEYERAFLLFDNANIDDARGVWRTLGGHAGLERNFWRQEDGRWIKAA